MCGLQIGVGPVLGVALPIARQRLGLRAGVVADVATGDDVAVGGVLVDVVAQVQDQLRLLFGEAPVGGEVPVLVLRARREAHRQRAHGARGRARAGPAHRGQLAARAEPVEVLAARGQPGQFDVHAVTEVGTGGLGAAPDHATEPLVLGDLPADVGTPVAQPAEAVRSQRVRCQPGPQDHPVGHRLAGGDTEGERVRPWCGRRRSGEPGEHRPRPGGRADDQPRAQHRAPVVGGDVALRLVSLHGAQRSSPVRAAHDPRSTGR